MSGLELQVIKNGNSINPHANVKEIDGNSIKLLAAGEKINDIETAIRELVENSIDAGAKNVEIRLAKFGIEAIEVEDNGIGIEENDFNFLGKRYHTSKISDLEKLHESLETFGFRGEALSCLCSIATVTITTKTKSSPTGWKLIFDKDASLSKIEPVGRDIGTTVFLKNIFHSFPVRRRELEKTAKRQYDRIVKLIYEQVLARPHVKFTLCKKSAGRKDKDFTHGGTTLEGCLTTIFGIKLLDTLIPLKQFIKGQLTSVLDPDIETEPDENLKVEHNESSRRHIKNEDTSSINNATLKNELLLLDQTLEAASLANGVGQDGYSMTHDESFCRSKEQSELGSDFDASSSTQLKLLAGSSKTTSRQPRDEFFKRSCRSKFARRKPIFKLHGFISKIGQGRNSSDGQFIYVNRKPCDIPKLTKVANEIYRCYSNNNQYPFFCIFIEVQTWAADFNVPRKRAVILQDDNKLCDLMRESLEAIYSSYVPATQKSCPVAQIPSASPLMGNSINSAKQKTSNRSRSPPPEPYPMKDGFRSGLELLNEENTKQMPKDDPPRESRPTDEGAPEKSTLDSNCLAETRSDLNKSNNAVRELETTSPQYTTSSNKRPISPGSSIEPRPVKKVFNHGASSPATKIKQIPLRECKFHQINAKVNEILQGSMQYMEDLGLALEREREQRKLDSDERQFSFAIHPKFNAPAEEELKFHLNKKSFADMQVIGQFNNGFIVARLNKHLFIIDQHATDERKNFEDQLKKSPLVKQPMVLPKPLYLNLIQENAILNSMDSFVKRGFEFTVDKSKHIGYRVMLSSTSICKGPTKDEYLGKEDIEELIDVAIESPHRLDSYVLSKVRTVSASVACRMSVMIGDSLNCQQMTDIVRNMSELNNPWVCAHNRPTIRHLMDVDWMN